MRGRTGQGRVEQGRAGQGRETAFRASPPREDKRNKGIGNATRTNETWRYLDWLTSGHPAFCPSHSEKLNCS